MLHWTGMKSKQNHGLYLPQKLAKAVGRRGVLEKLCEGKSEIHHETNTAATHPYILEFVHDPEPHTNR